MVNSNNYSSFGSALTGPRANYDPTGMDFGGTPTTAADMVSRITGPGRAAPQANSMQPSMPSTANLGGVFGAKASPYLGALLRGILGGANFQQPKPTPPASSGTFLPQSSQMRYPFTQPTWIPPRQAPPGMAPESWQKGWNIQYAQPDQMQYLPQQGSFDEQAYLQMYPDVAASVKAGLTPSGLWHYQNYGKTEGRSLPGNAMAQSAAGPAVGGTAMSGTAANGMPSNQQDFISMLMSGGLPQA